MKRGTRKIAVLLAVILLVSSLAGCGNSGVGDYASTVVATYGSEKINLDEANFWLRYNQWINEAYYWELYTYFGYDNMWEAAYTDTETMGEYMHASVMSQILQMRVLIDHAADYEIELTEDQKTQVSDTVEEFLETYPLFTEHCDVTAEQMEEWIGKNALASLVIRRVKDDAGITIADEDCEEYSVEYILVEEPEEEDETGEEDEEEEESEEDEDAEEEEEEGEPAPVGEELAAEVYEMALDGVEFDEIAETLGVTNETESYLLTGETSEDNLYTMSSGMEAGEVEEMAVEGTGWYIAKKLNDLDEEATEEKREELTEEAEDEAFEEVYAEWADAAPKFSVKEKIWSQVTITDRIYEEETEEEDEDEEEFEEDEGELEEEEEEESEEDDEEEESAEDEDEEDEGTQESGGENEEEEDD